MSGRSGGKAKSSKSSVKGTGSEAIATRTEKLATSRNGDVVTLLRRALRNDDGSDRDLLAELPSFTAFKRNGLDLKIEFRCGKTLAKEEAIECFSMAKLHMKEEYNKSGYGWDGAPVHVTDRVRARILARASARTAHSNRRR